MKKVFLAAMLIAAISTSALADGKKSAQLLNDLKASLKNVNESAWTTKDSYRQASFLYNGKTGGHATQWNGEGRRYSKNTGLDP